MIRREFLLSIAAPTLFLPIYPKTYICDEQEEYIATDLGDEQKVDYIFKKILATKICSCIINHGEGPVTENFPVCYVRRKSCTFPIISHIKYSNYDNYADDCWKTLLSASLDHREIRGCTDLEMMRETFRLRGKKLTDVFLDTYMRFEHEPIPEIQIHKVHIRKYIEFMEDKLGFDGQFKEYDILVGMDLSNKDNFIVPMKDDMYGCAVLDADCVILGQI